MNRRMLFAAATALLLLASVVPSEADTSDLQASIDSVHEPIFDGLGNLHHPVSTKTNPALAQMLVTRLKTGSGGIPRYFQVVLSVKAMDDVPVKINYMFHRELPDRVGHAGAK